MATSDWMLSGIEMDGASALILHSIVPLDRFENALTASAINSRIAVDTGLLSDLLNPANTSPCTFSADHVRASGFGIILSVDDDVAGIELRGPSLPTRLLCRSASAGFDGWAKAVAGATRYAQMGALKISTVTSLSPAACWPLSDSASTQQDIVGAYNATRYSGSASIDLLEADALGSFVMGSASYVRTPNISAIDAGSFTVVVDVQTTESGNKVIIEHGSDNKGFSIQTSPGIEVPAGFVFVAFGPSDARLASTFAINDGKPHRIALVWNASTSTAALYVDGIMGYRIASRGPISAPAFNTNYIDIGSRGGAAPMTAGTLLACAALYNRALGDGDIATMFDIYAKPIRAVMQRNQALAFSAPVPAASVRGTQGNRLARDTEFGGRARIAGDVGIKGASGAPDTMTQSRVRLLRARDGLLAREVWSDPVTGAFAFDGLDEATEFIALAQDSSGSFRPVAADRVLPEVPA